MKTRTFIWGLILIAWAIAGLFFSSYMINEENANFGTYINIVLQVGLLWYGISKVNKTIF